MYLQYSNSTRMKTKLRLIFLLSVFGNSIWAQNGVGVSYSMRVFPFQHYENASNRYLYETTYDDYGVSVSEAYEHNLSIYYQTPNKQKQRSRQIGVNLYGARINFSRSCLRSDANADVGGSSGTITIMDKSASCQYMFLGFSYASLKTRRIKNHFSFVTGTSTSINFLISENTFNKLRTTTETYYTATTSGPYAGTSYSTTKTTTNQTVQDAHLQKLNLKFELPFALKYSSEKNDLYLGFSMGISTQSRILSSTVMFNRIGSFNLFINPTIGYTYFLK